MAYWDPTTGKMNDSEDTPWSPGMGPDGATAPLYGTQGGYYAATPTSIGTRGGSLWGGAWKNTYDTLSGLGGGTDWSKALDAYLAHTGNNSNDINYWGDAAGTRAYLQGAGYADPSKANLWTDYLATHPDVAATERTQQSQAAGTADANAKAAGWDMKDFIAPYALLSAPLVGTALTGLGGAAAGGAGVDLGAGSVLGGAGSFEGGLAGLGGVGSGAAGTGISTGLGAEAGGLLGGAGSFDSILAGGGLDGITGAATGALGGVTPLGTGGTSLSDLSSVPTPGTGYSGGPTAETGTGGGSGGSPLSGTPGGDVTGSTGSDWATGDYSGLPSGPSGLDVPGGLDAINPGGATGGLGGYSLGDLAKLPTSAIKSIFGTTDAGAASIMSLLGKLGAAGLGAYASSQNTDALKAIADRTWNAGQQYRDNASRAMTPGFDVRSIPGLSSAMDTATETYLRKLSATGGNPTGIGAAPSQTEAYVLGNVALPAYQNYFNQNASAGGLAALAQQATPAAQNAAQSSGNFYNAIGAGINDIFNPQPTLAQQMMQYQQLLKGGVLT